MAAATVTNQQTSVVGNRRISTATFTTVADTNTWDTGLTALDFVAFTIEESSGSASDAISSASISGGIVTVDVQGTVDKAYAFAIGR